jgi:hypothetical protein
MPNRFAMRLTPELLDNIGQLTGEDASGVFADVPYVVVTLLAVTELNVKFMSEDQMLAEFKDDRTLQILN